MSSAPSPHAHLFRASKLVAKQLGHEQINVKLGVIGERFSALRINFAASWSEGGCKHADVVQSRLEIGMKPARLVRLLFRILRIWVQLQHASGKIRMDQNLCATDRSTIRIGDSSSNCEMVHIV